MSIARVASRSSATERDAEDFSARETKPAYEQHRRDDREDAEPPQSAEPRHRAADAPRQRAREDQRVAERPAAEPHRGDHDRGDRPDDIPEERDEPCGKEGEVVAAASGRPVTVDRRVDRDRERDAEREPE